MIHRLHRFRRLSLVHLRDLCNLWISLSQVNNFDQLTFTFRGLVSSRLFSVIVRTPSFKFACTD